ncbi:Aste57867_14309 [Aphanomyces stellatus]|uniref:Aste57867_14309 protein n=1 Tax=Aphanomyces stellatus TaxID=120398 RepID=A0A485L0D4_9STRA|nr:hypothetical protein As57867_014256 [Aphanomyces stellatus]VFT91134.1 Aste57867_14309 [Aphanomyces stellatus]
MITSRHRNRDWQGLIIMSPLSFCTAWASSSMKTAALMQRGFFIQRYSSTAAASPSYHEFHLRNGTPMHYAKYGPADGKASLVLLHGAPGSHLDFKHLSPLLTREHINVITFDLPGNGRTSADAAGGTYKLSDKTVAAAATEALEGIKMHNCFILGHSFGSHTAIRVAASSPHVRGLALLAPASLRPHKALRAFPMVRIGRWLQVPGPWRSVIALLNKWLYIHAFKFSKRTPHDDFTFALQRVGSADFSDMQTIVDGLRRLPTFVALALDDALIEPLVIRELGARLPDGHRVEYPTGGHNIQKTRAKELAPALVTWIDNVLAEGMHQV